MTPCPRSPRRGGSLGLALVFAILALVIAAPAFALPKGLAHVDPKAPCFRWPAVDYDGDGVFDRIDRCPNTPKGCAVDEWGCSLDADGDGVCDGLDQCPNTPRGEAVDVHGCSRSQRAGAQVKETPPPPPPPPPPHEEKPQSEVERQLVKGGKVRLENIYFETNSATLLPESETTLREAGDALAKYPDLKVEVQGHTDMRGAARYNMRLSQQRAEAVRQYLLDHFSIRPENLVAKGYGETQPETKERNDEERLRDRRVVLNVLNPDVLPGNVKIEKH